MEKTQKDAQILVTNLYYLYFTNLHYTYFNRLLSILTSHTHTHTHTFHPPRHTHEQHIQRIDFTILSQYQHSNI